MDSVRGDCDMNRASLGDYVKVRKLELGKTQRKSFFLDCFLLGMEGKIGRCIELFSDCIYVKMLDWDVTLMVKHGDYTRVIKVEKWKEI